MNHTLIMNYDESNNLNIYIEYLDSNNKTIDKIELINNNYEIYKDENYIFFLENNKIEKLFDINHKSYINDKLTMYNEFNNYIKKIKPKKNKTNSYKMN